MSETTERKIKRLTRALQRIADLPEPEKLTRPYKRTPKRIAIAALKHAHRQSSETSHGDLIEALRPFAWYFDVNDCKDRREDDALEVPIRDLRIAFELFEAMGLAVSPIPAVVGEPSK